MAPKTKEKAETPTSTYELGDTVLGKIRGYPPWPGQVRAKLVATTSFVSNMAFS